MSSTENALLHLTQSQAINIASYKHHKLNHSINFDRATLIDGVEGSRLRVLGYKYVDFPLHDGLTRGVISSCFYIEYDFNSNGNVSVHFDTENFSIFGKNFRILNENGSGFIDGSDLEQIMRRSGLDYKDKYYPVSSDISHFISELEREIKITNPTLLMIKTWMCEKN